MSNHDCVFGPHMPLISRDTGDIGGSLGLFLGASVLTLFGLIDVIIHYGVRKLCNQP